MGGRAHSLTVGLAAPADLPVQWALDLARGIGEEAPRSGARVVGGDLTRAEQVVIAVTVLGACDGGPRAPVRCARPATWSRSRAGRAGPPAGSPCSAAASARRACWSRPTGGRSRRTTPGRWPREAGATSMIDVSDGLLADLGHVAEDSGVAIDVEHRRLRAGRAAAGGGRRARRRPDAVRARRR